MKNIWLFLFLLFSGLCFPQSYSKNYYGFLEELYIDRQPSAKGQSMGGGLVAYSETEFGSYYNPALTSLSEGLTVNTSFSNNYKNYNDAKFNYFGTSYKIKNIGSFSLSRYQINYQTYDFKNNYHSIYNLNYSKEIVKNFYAGVNVNLLTPHFAGMYEPIETNKTIYIIDIGILIKIPVENSSKNISQLFQIGSAYTNLNRTKYDNGLTLGNTQYYPLPAILRLGGSYKVKYKRDDIIKKLNLIGLLAHVEFEAVTNSSRYVKIKLGGEVTFFDIFSFRAGYTIGNTFERSTSGKLNGDSYGAGVKIPVDLIFQLASPLSLSIDYVNLEQPPERDSWNGVERFGRFNTVSLKLNWVPTI